jgi:hypothetical protein
VKTSTEQQELDQTFIRLNLFHNLPIDFFLKLLTTPTKFLLESSIVVCQTPTAAEQINTKPSKCQQIKTKSLRFSFCRLGISEPTPNAEPIRYLGVACILGKSLAKVLYNPAEC